MKKTFAIFLTFCTLNAINQCCYGARPGKEIQTGIVPSNITAHNFYKYHENLDKPFCTFYLLEKPQFTMYITSITELGRLYKRHRGWLDLLSTMAKWNLKQARKFSIQYPNAYVSGRLLEECKSERLNIVVLSLTSRQCNMWQTQLDNALREYEKSAIDLYTKLTKMIGKYLFAQFTSDFIRSLSNVLKSNITDTIIINKIIRYIKNEQLTLKIREKEIDISVKKLQLSLPKESYFAARKLKAFSNNLITVENKINILSKWKEKLCQNSTVVAIQEIEGIFDKISHTQHDMINRIKKPYLL